MTHKTEPAVHLTDNRVLCNVIKHRTSRWVRLHLIPRWCCGVISTAGPSACRFCFLLSSPGRLR